MICIRSNITVFMMGMEKGISYLYGTVIFKEKELKNQLIAYSNRFGEGNGTPLQCSCLENPMDGGAWWAAVHGVAESRTRLSDFTFTFHFHALEKAVAPHSSVLAWRIPGTGAWWAAVYGVARSWTRLKRLGSSNRLGFWRLSFPLGSWWS